MTTTASNNTVMAAAKNKKESSTLIDNWVEEVWRWQALVTELFSPFLQRQCSQYDKDNRNEDGTLNKALMRSGHKVSS